MSLHRKAHHPVEYNWDALALVSSRNVLCTEGEMHMMAGEEVRWWRLDPHLCGLNEFIKHTLVHRSIDSINGKRRDGNYRVILAEVEREVASAARGEVFPSHAESNTDLACSILVLMEALGAMVCEMNIDNNLSFVGDGDVDGFLEYLYFLLGVIGAGQSAWVVSQRP